MTRAVAWDQEWQDYRRAMEDAADRYAAAFPGETLSRVDPDFLDAEEDVWAALEEARQNLRGCFERWRRSRPVASILRMPPGGA